MGDAIAAAAAAPAVAATEAQTDSAASTETAEGQASQTPPTPKKPSIVDEFKAKFTEASNEDVEQLVREALKRAPIKTKSGKDEFIVDDFDKVKRAVSMDRHFDKIGNQINKEKAALEEEKARVQKILSGDPGTLSQLLSDENFKATVSNILYQQMQEQQQLQQMDPQQRSILTENQRLKAEMQQLQAERQRREQEAQAMEEQRLLEATKEELGQYFISGMEAVKAPPHMRPALALFMQQRADMANAFGGPLGPEQLGQMAMDDMRTVLGSIFSAEGEDLINAAGEELAAKFAKAYVNRFKSTQQPTQPKTSIAAQNTNTEKPRAQSDINGSLWREMQKLGVGRWHR
jgi:hypothetical protein